MRGKIIAGFALAFAVLAAAVLVAYQSTQRLIAGGQSVAHTQEVLTELRTIQSLVQEAESAVRGYLLTGNPKFLEPYATSARRIHPQIGRMRALTADDPWQEVPLRRLEARIEEKLAWNSRAISRRPGQDPAAARAMIESSEAGRLMEQIRHDLRIMREEAERLFAARTADAKSRVDSALLVLAGGALLQFLVLLAVFYAMNRDTAARGRTAEQLRQQLSFTAAITDNLGEGVYALDAGGRVSLMNPAAQAMLGWTQEELLGRNMHEAIHFLSRDGARVPASDCPVLGVLRSGERFHSADDVFTRRDGSVFSVEYISSPFRLDGQVVGAVVAFQDVTDRKKTESELLERAGLAAFAADVGSALTKAETLPKALTQCAEAIVRHLGGAMASIWRLEESGEILALQGSAWARRPLFGPDARIPVGEFRIGAIARDRKPALLDLTAQIEREDDKDWARREGMVAFAGYPLIVEERLVGVMAMFAKRPLTETAVHALASVADEIALGIDRSQASAALRASEARTRSIIDNMLEGLILVNEQGVIRSANPSARRIFDYREEDLVGRPLTVLVPDSAAPDGLGFLQEGYRKAIGRTTQWEGKRRNGEAFPFELTLFEFRTAEGRLFGGSIRDLSQSREVEKLKKEFVSTVSHELRTPLTSIRGSLGLLAAGVLGRLPPGAAEAVAVAERNVVRLVRLIGDILDSERLETGKLALHLEIVPLADVFARSLEAVRAFAEQERVLIATPASSLAVWGDGDRLVQVLVNLLSNAVKFSPAGSEVTLSAELLPGRVEVRVADHGRGIPAGFREAIFERFRQVESTDARQKGGTGLGLSICKAIIELHGGAIGVESEEGKGSTFWFRVPLAPLAAEEARLEGRAAATPGLS